MKKSISILFRESLVNKDYKVFLLFLFFGLILKLVYIFGSVIWSTDLYFYIQGAKTMMDGGVLYKDFGEVKPPGIFFIYLFLAYAGCYKNILILIKIVSIAFQTFTAFFFYKIGKGLWDIQTGIILGFGYLIAISINYQFWPANVMPLYILPVSIGLFLLVKNEFRLKPSDIFWSGLFFCLGFLISSNVIFYVFLFPVLAYHITKSIKSSLKKSIIAFSGFMVPLVFLFYYFYHNHALYDWYWWNLKWAGIYGNFGPFWQKVLKIFSGMLLNWTWYPLYFFSFTGIYKIFKDRLYLKDKSAFFAVSILLVSLLSRVMLDKYVSRYNLYLLPGLLLCSYLSLKIKFKAYTKIILCLLIISGFIYMNIASLSAPYQKNIEAKKDMFEWIQKNTKDTDKIFVWQEAGEIYFFSGRPMATSFFSPYMHLYSREWRIENYKYLDYPWNKFFGEFQRDKPLLVIDTSGNFSLDIEDKSSGKLKEYMIKFKNMVKGDYNPAIEFGSIKIWKRKN
jgi:hypothetical protein